MSRLTVRLPETLHNQLAAQAKREAAIPHHACVIASFLGAAPISLPRRSLGDTRTALTSRPRRTRTAHRFESTWVEWRACWKRSAARR